MRFIIGEDYEFQWARRELATLKTTWEDLSIGESLFLVSIFKGKEHRLMHLDIKLSLAERVRKMDRTKLDNEIIFFWCFCVIQACNRIFIP